MGSSKVIFSPPSNEGSAVNFPSCASAILCAIDKPSPEPPESRLRELSTRNNRSNKRGINSGEIPGSLSSKQIVNEASFLHCIFTRPPSWV